MFRFILLLFFFIKVLSFNKYYYIRKIKLDKILEKIENNKIKNEILKEIEHGEYNRKLEEEIKNTNDAFNNLKKNKNR